MSNPEEIIDDFAVLEDERVVRVNSLDNFPMRGEIIKDKGYYVLSWDTLSTGLQAFDLLTRFQGMESGAFSMNTPTHLYDGTVQEALAEVTADEQREAQGVSIENQADEGRVFWSAPDDITFKDIYASFAITGVHAARILSVEPLVSQTILEEYKDQTAKYVTGFSKVFDRIMRGLPEPIMGK